MTPAMPAAPGVARRMALTIAALLPLLVVEAFGRGAPWIAAMLSGLALAVALAWAARHARRQPGADFSTDLDVVVVVLLIGLLLPAGGTWRASCLAVAVALVVGRQAFGGVGQAVFNPAMLGLAVTALMPSTPMDTAAWSAWAAPAAWLGASAMVLQRIVAWRIPLAFLFGALVMAVLLPQPGMSASTAALSVASHPAWVLCAFFVAGDSATGCLHPRARVAFGLGCGLLVVAFEHWRPALGMPMAVLLLNFVAPWLDQALAAPRQRVLPR